MPRLDRVRRATSPPGPPPMIAMRGWFEGEAFGVDISRSCWNKDLWGVAGEDRTKLGLPFDVFASAVSAARLVSLCHLYSVVDAFTEHSNVGA